MSTEATQPMIKKVSKTVSKKVIDEIIDEIIDEDMNTGATPPPFPHKTVDSQGSSLYLIIKKWFI